MRITKRQLTRIIKEEKRKLLKEQGDPIADQLLGKFIGDLEEQLLDMYDKQDAHRLGSEEDFRVSVNMITVDVENLVRKRLGELWSGDIKLELVG
jgi:hypothetical protein